MQNILENLNFI